MGMLALQLRIFYLFFFLGYLFFGHHLRQLTTIPLFQPRLYESFVVLLAELVVCQSYSR